MGENVLLLLFLMDRIVPLPDYMHMMKLWISAMGYQGHVDSISATDL